MAFESPPVQPGRSRPRRWAGGVWRGIGMLVGGLGWLWVLAALWYLPARPVSWQWLAPAIWVLGSIVVWLFKPRWWRWAGLVTGVIVAAGLTQLRQPINDRWWLPDQERLPGATLVGDQVVIENVRHATYRTADDFDVRWETRRYDLTAIRTVEFIIEPFSSWQGLAHTFLTFGFADGEYVAISVEIRKERGESYSPLRGLFRHYEIAYVIGDERDLIGLRANIRRDPVMLYPIRATPEQVRALFVSMLTRANQLRAEPEFYHSLFNTCTTNIVHHVNELRRQQLGLGWRTIFPGYADGLVQELELLDFDGTLEEARRRFLINERAAFDDTVDGREWSRRLRVLPPAIEPSTEL